MPLPLDHLRRSQQVLRDNCLSLPPRCSFFHRQSRHTLDETANLSSSKVHNQQILSISGENIAEEIVKGRIDKYDHVCIGGRSTKRNDLRPLTGVGADTSLCPLLFPGVRWGSTYPANDHSKWQLRETRLKWLQYNHREKKIWEEIYSNETSVAILWSHCLHLVFVTRWRLRESGGCMVTIREHVTWCVRNIYREIRTNLL